MSTDSSVENATVDGLCINGRWRVMLIGGSNRMLEDEGGAANAKTTQGVFFKKKLGS